MRKVKYTLDPRGCGNDAMRVNHSCDSKSFLYEMDIGGKKIFVIKELRPIPPGPEITIDYGYNSIKYFTVLFCLCNTDKCRLAV